MKKIKLIVLFALIGYTSTAQYGGTIRAVNNSNVIGEIRRNGNALLLWDSTANVYNLAQKLKMDSLYTKINSTIAVTLAGHDSTTDSRIGVKLIQNPTIANTSFAVTNAGTFHVQVDSSTQRSSIKVSQLPSITGTVTANIGTGGYAVSASDSTKYRITHKISESALPTGAATESTLSTLNGKVPSGLTVNSNRLAIYAPDSIRVFATNGFGSGGGGGGGGGDASAANQVTHNTLLQGIKTIDSNINLAMSDVYSNLVSINGMVSELPAQTTSLSSIDSKLTDIIGYTDQIEGGISTTNSTLSNSNALLQGIKTLDSTINNKLNDSIRVFATNGFGSGGGGGDSTTNSRIGIKLIQNPTITNTSFGISGSLPAFASTPTVNIGTTGTIPVSGTFWQATQPVSLSSVPSHAVTNAGTFAVQVDSSTQRSSIKVSQLPSITGTVTANIGTGGYAVSASDSTKYRITHKISESALPTGAATESTLSTLNGKIPSGLTVNSNRLAIYSPDSIRVFATNGFGSGGGGGGGGSGTEYAEGTTTSPATGTSALFRYNATQPTLTDGAMSMPQLDVNGNSKVCLPDKRASGVISAQNLVPAGVATANSAVELEVNGYGTVTVQITGTYTGVRSLQFTNNGTTWVTMGSISCFYNIGTNSITGSIGSGTQGFFKVPTFGANKIRITALAAVTGSSTVTIVANTGTSTVMIESGFNTLPVNISSAGNSTILKAEDNASANADNGVATWGVRRDDLTISASATGDYSESSVTKFGARYVKDEERQKLSYVVSTSGINMPASCTDIFTLTPNSVAKQINITKVTIWGTASTATLADILFMKRSTVNSAGTTETIMDMNEADVNSNSRAYSYATVPTTLGTAITGNIKLFPAMFNLTSVAPEKYEFNFGELGKPLILRASTGESFCVNMGTATIPGGRFYISVEFTEE